MEMTQMGNQQERPDAARLAMLFDTEGHLTIRVIQRSKKRPLDLRPEIGCTNTNFELMEWAAGVLKEAGIPCHLQYIDCGKYVAGRKPQKRLSIVGFKRVSQVLPFIKHYLIGKVQQANLLEEFLTLRKEAWLKDPKHRDYSIRELEIADTIRSLNTKGRGWRPVSSTTTCGAAQYQKHLGRAKDIV